MATLSKLAPSDVWHHQRPGIPEYPLRTTRMAVTR